MTLWRHGPLILPITSKIDIKSVLTIWFEVAVLPRKLCTVRWSVRIRSLRCIWKCLKQINLSPKQWVLAEKQPWFFWTLSFFAKTVKKPNLLWLHSFVLFQFFEYSKIWKIAFRIFQNFRRAVFEFPISLNTLTFNYLDGFYFWGKLALLWC